MKTTAIPNTPAFSEALPSRLCVRGKVSHDRVQLPGYIMTLLWEESCSGHKKESKDAEVSGVNCHNYNF